MINQKINGYQHPVNYEINTSWYSVWLNACHFSIDDIRNYFFFSGFRFSLIDNFAIYYNIDSLVYRNKLGVNNEFTMKWKAQYIIRSSRHSSEKKVIIIVGET